MSKALDLYNQSTNSSSVLSGIYAYMDKHVGSLDMFEIKELLRAEYVMIVSAFDTYFHNCVLLKMTEMFIGNTEKSKGFNNYSIPLDIVCAIIESESTITRIELIQNAIRKINSKDSYQGKNSIEYALSLVGINRIWKRLSEEMGRPCDDIQRELNIIMKRRNQIAHESDYDYSINMKRDITLEDLTSARSFLTNIVKTIDTWI